MQGLAARCLSNLLPDQEYFAAVTTVDVAGNSEPAVTTLRIFLESQIPPPVTPTIASTGIDSAHLDWSGYDTSALVGMAGFRVFAQTAPFTDVSGLTPLAELPATTKEYDLSGLDRSQSHYLAVVALNIHDGFDPAVTPVVWSDPLAGSLRVDLAIGGPSAVVPILGDLTIEDGATLTIAPGTTLRFADGTGIEVLDGRIVANGTDMRADPFHLGCR